MNRGPADQRPPSIPSLDELLVDRNQDGFPDDIAGLFVVQEPLDQETWAAVFNLSARLGLGSSGFTPPVVVTEPLADRVPIYVRPGDAERLNALATHTPGEVSDEGATDTGSISHIDLSDPWSIDGFLVDRDGDQAADDAAIHLLIPERLPLEVGAALAEVAARIGIECAALTMPVAGGDVPPGRVPLVIRLDQAERARVTGVTDGSLELSGSPAAVSAFLTYLAGMSSGFLPRTPGTEAVNWLRRAMAGWNEDGKAARIRQAVIAANDSPQTRFAILEQDADLRNHLYAVATRADASADVTLSAPREAIVFDHQWTAEWEVDRVLKTLDSDILHRLDPAVPVSLIVLVSEPPLIRRRLRGQITRRMLDLGFSQGSVHVLDAFKPGLSWLQEVVLPELREIENIDRVDIQFAPWNPDEHDGPLDMPIRWLQELFPADEILAGELGVPLDRIALESVHDLASIYRVHAVNAAGDTLLEREFSPLWRRIDYLAGFPGAGNVTVTTGGIVAEQDGQIRRAHVLTDPEIFWRYVQGELLPKLRRFILSHTGSQPSESDQPFFDDLFVDLRISESDEPYGIRQERHSAAEALHEDIYFNVLDFVDELGRQTSGEKLSAPGSVRPFVTVQPGRQPEARIRLTRRPAGIARMISGGTVSVLQPASKTLPGRPRITALEYRNQQWVIEVAPSSEIERFRPFLEALAAECPSDGTSTVLRIPAADGSLEIGTPDGQEFVEGEVSDDDNVPWDTIISNEEIFSHLYRMAEHPAVTVIPAAERSWQGRPIPTVALTSPQAAVWSMRKLSHFKPTMLIVARHHANEVSSTTAALQLIVAVTGDSEWSRLLEAVNIVLLPLENPDGAALHDELRRDNPTWKHHPARYNATGYEFGEDQGNPDTPYGEGRVRDLVWKACLPDIVVDNHGVPSHEWAQLFAGFGSPPRFNVSYWQVQALLYGILPYLEDPAHIAAAEALRDRVASKIAGDRDVLKWNQIYAERYRTWGHRWMPERFPMTLFQEMIFHTGPVEPESPRARRSYAVRFPRTSVVNWVTEVCDETVDGQELERTARAHLLANLAALELLRDSAESLRMKATAKPHGVSFRVGRDRPLTVRPVV